LSRPRFDGWRPACNLGCASSHFTRHRSISPGRSISPEPGPTFQCGGNAVVRFAALSQSVARLAPSVLDQQTPVQPSKPIFRLILIDGIFGPAEQGNMSGAFDAYSWTWNNDFNPGKRTSALMITDVQSAGPALFNACSSGRRIGRVRYVIPKYYPTQMEIYTLFGVTISQIDNFYSGTEPSSVAITFNFGSLIDSIRPNSERL
jgi:type VI protein secretion system component Hcp